MPAPGEHPLFKAYPETGSVNLTTGVAPTPYRVFDGHGVLFIGMADLAVVSSGFRGQDVHPVTTRSGNALIAIFVCDFHTASLGAHQELQIAALASAAPGLQISDDPAEFFAAFARHPEWGLLSLHLWNDTAPVLAYNTEYLGLDAAPVSGRIDLDATAMVFDFSNTDGLPLVSGLVAMGRKSDAGFMFKLMWEMGPAAVLRAARQDHATAYLINRKGAIMAQNRRARAMTATDQVVTRRFDANYDQLQLHHADLASYAFKPLAMQFFNPFRFVYLHPDQS